MAGADSNGQELESPGGFLIHVFGAQVGKNRRSGLSWDCQSKQSTYTSGLLTAWLLILREHPERSFWKTGLAIVPGCTACSD